MRPLPLFALLLLTTGCPEPEVCTDGLDNDGDALVDADDPDCAAADTDEPCDTPTSFYADSDGDGYGDPASAIQACEAPSGTVTDATDCDDGDASIHPGADEICNDTDDDCDGLSDEDAVDAAWWYIDHDGDGYGVSHEHYNRAACEQPPGYADNADDCDDAHADAHPGADEVWYDGIDQDCTGGDDYDHDADGYQSADHGGDDCDDDDAEINPGADELCSTTGVDDDCDGSADDDSAIDTSTWYTDADSDGFGDPGVTHDACVAPSGYVADNTDCDDGDAAQYPGADERCNGEDDDCDGATDEDEAEDATTWYADSDGDGYGDASSSAQTCTQPSGYTEDDTDCDDTDMAINPAADELCDGIDNDCDGATDEDDAVDATTWYADADSDGYGDLSTSTRACTQPSDHIGDGSDCDDSDATINPAATEVCDGADNDCDGGIDEDDALDASTWYLDADGDGYGDVSSTTVACDQPSTYVAVDTDCDDGDDAQYPGADEYCNGEDDDCDGTTDEDGAVDAATWYLDGDGDGYGDASSNVQACSQPSSYIEDDMDCDDGDAAINPAADESCDGVDNDCDGDRDEDDAIDASIWYADDDGDGYGDVSSTAQACSQPAGYLGDDTDCDDGDAAINPAASEVCDGADNDCDGRVDPDDAADVSTWYLDADGDGYGDASSSTGACELPSGYAASDTDCDDGDATISPGASEVCDEIDNDCDGLVDDDDSSVMGSTWYADADLDGYGDSASTVSSCSEPSGYVDDDSDCDDSDADVNPDGTEVYGNGVDEDCDGSDSQGFECTGYEVPGDFGTIASAVTALASTDATICLTDPSYSEDVTFYGSGQLVVMGISRDVTTVTGDWDINAWGGGSFTLQGLTVEGTVDIGSYDTVSLHDLSIDSTGATAVSISNLSSSDTLEVDIRQTDINAGGATYGVQSHGYPRTIYLTLTNSYVHDAATCVSFTGYSSYQSKLYSYSSTFYDCDTGIYAQDPYTNARTYIYNSVIVGMGVAIQTDVGSFQDHRYNALYDNTTNYAGGATAGSGYVTSDPELDYSVDPPRPSTTSPILDAGSPSFGLIDYYNNTRGDPPDLGCVEVSF